VDARRFIAGGLNYVFKSLDLIPDGLEGLGYLDDALVVRSAAHLAGSAPGAKEADMRGVLARLSGDVNLISEFLGPDADRLERYVRELMNMSGLALHTIQDELRKLNALGLIVTWSNGYHRFYRANQDHPLFESLLHIVQGSVKLPSPRQILLRQPRRRRPSKRRTGRRALPLPKDWPGKWDLFSNRRQT